MKNIGLETSKHLIFNGKNENFENLFKRGG